MVDFKAVAEIEHDEAQKVMPVMYSEIAMKCRVVYMHRENFRFMPEREKFLIWDRTRWCFDERRLVNSEVDKICSAASKEALIKIKNKSSAERIATRLASGRTVREIMGLLKSEQGLILTAAEADKDPWQLNTPTGTVDLKTGTVHKHKQENHISKCTTVGPEDKECTNWMHFLGQTTQGNNELISYLQRLCGYSLTGLTTEQMLAFIWGPGGNGKGVFLNTIINILGDYAKLAGSEVFMASRMERHPTELAGLQGARLVVGSEVEENSRWNESRIKSLTGGDLISARYMRQDFFTFIPQFTLVISGNQKPHLKNIDDAIRRRMHLIPFMNKPENVDTASSDKLKEEWPRILNWMIEGCLDWQSRGLLPPLVVLDATEEYFHQEDKLGNWIEECCVQSPDHFTSTNELFRRWSQWCEDNNERKGNKIGFSRKLGERGYRHGQSSESKSRSRGFKGLQLLDNQSDSGTEARNDF